ncbi:MAG: VOC family protein [Pseudomonadales bacterium]|jgi:catechol 2,3-dioxygenase-like lactoylglutathione lyase family enzyme|nr:VOC family protein [Pseudomonadales bacterium]MDP7147006.1 VOC family protein [Pseudomonadales bacterium]MDP7359164.1 VOC family protein [Pseudomonadales bacterium]MDP7596111.1 VOC family protein [Pseudomonadales bacterium]HJN50661.1 VOC family protein [Pseudomonadales bacterium]|tara:strand:- start:443 stop:904 length:462 start_codon:yes stop_codon:yes gene_type:complete
MINGIHHTALSVKDMDRSLAFYRDLLGLELSMDRSWDNAGAVGDKILRVKGTAARQTMLRIGNSNNYIELFQFNKPEPTPMAEDRPVIDRGITHICLDVTDVDSEYERLSVAGVIFHCEPQDLGLGCRTTYGRDPDGNVVEFQELFNPPRKSL